MGSKFGPRYDSGPSLADILIIGTVAQLVAPPAAGSGSGGAILPKGADLIEIGSVAQLVALPAAGFSSVGTI